MPVAPELSAKYELVSPSGYRCTFNDPSDPDYVGPLTDHSGFDSPEIREEAENRPGTDGGVHGQFLFGRRSMTLTGKVLNPVSTIDRANRLEVLQRTVLDCLKSDGTLTWTLSSGQTLTIKVRTQQPLRTEGAWQKQFQIALAAADPLIYSTSAGEHVSTWSFLTGGANSSLAMFYPQAPVGTSVALGFPWEFPAVWSHLPSPAEGAVVSHAAKVTTLGTASTPPRIFLNGPINSSGGPIYFHNVTTGEVFKSSAALPSVGDRLDIDMQQKTIKRNGLNAYTTVDAPNSDWWSLVPGTNDVRVYVTGAIGDGAFLQMSWRDAWN